MSKKRSGGPTVIKKYANRRLYDTGRSSYVTLDDLCEMVKEGHDFVVQDAKTGEDLTQQVLTQIIVEQEAGGQGMLPIPFLRQLISLYGDSLQGLVPNYLEQSIGTFKENQDKLRSQFEKSFANLGGGMMNPMTAMEEMGRKNMQMFESAMRAWTPFAGGGGNSEARIRELKKTIAELQKELDRLSGRS